MTYVFVQFLLLVSANMNNIHPIPNQTNSNYQSTQQAAFITYVDALEPTLKVIW